MNGRTITALALVGALCAGAIHGIAGTPDRVPAATLSPTTTRLCHGAPRRSSMAHAGLMQSGWMMFADTHGAPDRVVKG